MTPHPPSLADPPRESLGGKAASLLELQLAGFLVPEFLCTDDADAAAATLGFPLAVRSSASAEDGSSSSFAGQFRSFLNLTTVEAVREAITMCLESVKSPSVVGYCHRAGIDPASLHMTVIVQRMVQAELSGVAFSVNPATGAEDVTIEACLGTGELLLSGQSASLPPDHPVLERHRAEITRLAREAQLHFGTPQDIEFAVENDTVFVLQARPITRIQFAPGTGEWTNADFRDGGVSCGVCTPLMWSLYDFIWEDALKGFLREIKLLRGDFQAGRLFFGRPYWNLGAVKECLSCLPGFVEREFDRDLGVEPSYEGDGRVTPMTWRSALAALPTLTAIPSIWKRQEAFDREFLDGGFARLVARFRDVPVDPDAQFRELIEDVYRTTETNYFRTIYCASLAKLAFMESFPDADYPALVSALPAMRHLDPTRAMREMIRRGERDIRPIQHAFPHRSRRELDISAPRWDEDAEWVAALLDGTSPEPGPDPRPAYETARAETLAGLPRSKRQSFERKLDRLRTFLWLREEMRDLSSRMYHIIRRHLLAIAAKRQLGDDIFFMTFQEIIADDRSGIEAARATHRGFRHFLAPNEIGSRHTYSSTIPSGALTGTAASRGCAQAKAHVARNIEEAMALEPGSVLVCSFTDPGWTPVLDRVAAVVTETGGLLSHAAVICREFGIPAVLGIPHATSRIPNAALVTVNGGTGAVTIDSPRPGRHDFTTHPTSTHSPSNP